MTVMQLQQRMGQRLGAERATKLPQVEKGTSTEASRTILILNMKKQLMSKETLFCEKTPKAASSRRFKITVSQSLIFQSSKIPNLMHIMQLQQTISQKMGAETITTNGKWHLKKTWQNPINISYIKPATHQSRVRLYFLDSVYHQTSK